MRSTSRTPRRRPSPQVKPARPASASTPWTCSEPDQENSAQPAATTTQAQSSDAADSADAPYPQNNHKPAASAPNATNKTKHSPHSFHGGNSCPLRNAGTNSPAHPWEPEANQQPTPYLQLPHRLTIGQICTELENWATPWFGPERAGTYAWTKMRKPPQAWLKSEIRRLQDKIEDDRITLINYYELLTGRPITLIKSTLTHNSRERLKEALAK